MSWGIGECRIGARIVYTASESEIEVYLGGVTFRHSFVKDNREAREITPRPLACPVGGSQTVFVHRGELLIPPQRKSPSEWL